MGLQSERMSAWVWSSEGLTPAGGFGSKMAHACSWYVQLLLSGSLSSSPHDLLEYPHDMVAGGPQSE